MATTNYAIRLDGVNQHWTINDNASFDYATGNAFTFGLWFWADYDYKSFSPDKAYLWSRENQHEMYIDNGELIYYFNGAGGAITWRTGVNIAPQRVHFLCITGSESTDTTLYLYLDGELKATKEVTGGMPSDTNTNLYFGIDYGTTANQYFKGTMTGFFQSKDTAVSASDVSTMWNSGVYDIDTTKAITGLDDSIGMEENTGTTYDNALNAGVDGAGQNTPLWENYLDLGFKTYDKMIELKNVGACLDMWLSVARVIWEGEDIADGDELKLVDSNGKVVLHEWSKTSDVGLDKGFETSLWWNGIEVSTLGHGKVLIRFD